MVQFFEEDISSDDSEFSSEIGIGCSSRGKEPDATSAKRNGKVLATGLAAAEVVDAAADEDMTTSRICAKAG